MTIYQFKPTWLIIKRHKTTGLLYLCKTCGSNPTKYSGSGKYWLRHLNRHGKSIDTVWMKLFDDQDILIPFATFLSNYFDIVNDKDNLGNKKWANLEIENGIEGMPPGTDRGNDFKNKCKLHKSCLGLKWWNNGSLEIKTDNRPTEGIWEEGRLFGLAEKINKTKIKNGNYPSGNKNGRYDHRIHRFINVDTGDIVESTQYEFYKSKTLCRRSINRLVDGSRIIFKGWIIERSG